MRILLLSLVALGVSTPALAQLEPVAQQAPAGSSGTYEHARAPIARASLRTTGIQLDGRLLESDWASAAAITDFLQTAPLEGEPVTERTDVRILYDSDAIYVGARLEDRSAVTTRLARRDAGLGDSDRFVVLFDSFHDHETAYRFWTNPSGVKGDAIVTGNSTGGGDSSWDPVWDLAVGVDEAGWVVEMRIPFSQLRFSPAAQQTWGVQVERTINRNQENATFPFTPLLERAGVSRFAHLEGLEDIDAGRPLELLPYVVARGEYTHPETPSGVGFPNPYRSGDDYFGGMGLDLKYRLTSNVTLDGTVNPDFGQVELDPSVINLTAFETRFSERRPFFVEGADIFTFGEAGPSGSVGRAPDIFYSRRIGRPPTGSTPSDAVYSDKPVATTILGAAKVTGRFGDGWSIGIMEAATSSESAAYQDAAGVPGEVTVEPFTNHFVGRVRRQIRGGTTRFGAIGTAVNRDIPTAELDARMHTSAYTGGFDFAHESTDRMWLFTGVVAGSRVAGSTDVLTRTQRSSRRYYQRPDADHVEIDPLATSLGGYYLMGYAGKQAGSFTMRNGFAYISPGFEANDLGFHSDADRILFDTHYQYNQPNPGRYFRSWSYNASPDFKWNTAGDRIFTNVNTQLSLELLNYWRGSVRLQFDPWTDDDRLTRGGPMAREPGAFDMRINLNSDGRRALVGRASYRRTTDASGAWAHQASLGFDARLQETFRLSFRPSFTRNLNTAQYVTSITDALATETFGSRYVFADIERTTLSLETRFDVTFTSTLSLQLYLEPFISVGDFGTYKELRAPRTYDFLEYGSDVGTVTTAPDGSLDIDPDGAGPAQSFGVGSRDFSFRSLLGNAVLRWEWRPGSTVFLVWQQRRINSVTGQGENGENPWVGSFDLGRDVGDMFDIAADNVLSVKVNYWLNP